MQTSLRPISILGLAGLFLALLLATAGCTGSSSTQSAHVRFINAVPNGGSASFSANGIFLGNEPFFQQSAYETVLTTPTVFSFFLSSNPATSFSSSSTTLTNGASYTAVGMGRADVTTSGTAGFPQIQATQDEQTAPPAGNIRLRIMDVAPDLAAINVLVNGTAKATNISYPSLGTYFTMAAGNLTIQAVLNVGGTAQTSSVVFMNIIAGHHYTAFVVETAITPTYTIELIDDTTNTLAP